MLGERCSLVMGPFASLGLSFLIYKMDVRASYRVAVAVEVPFIIKMMVVILQVSLPC